MRLYGLYLYRSSEPLYTGTQADCHRRAHTLSDAEWLHGWTVRPVDSKPAGKRASPAWALVGAGLLFSVVVLAVFALRGHL